jgi:16S rRNA (adenine1518-N6/adenine1519-N6)-dimethyltransferase
MVKPKKHLGQHFLTDIEIAENIVSNLSAPLPLTEVLEIGPGMGILTKLLLLRKDIKLSVIDIDNESVEFLKREIPELKNRIIHHDFLQLKLTDHFSEQVAIIGNFPYNISSQILFKVLDDKELIPEVVGMFQKEVAIRIASKPGNRDYGILSVLMQAWYNVEYLFTVDEHVFNPPPKVKSGVLRFTRKQTDLPKSPEKTFRMVVKTAFNQRRKTLRNALKSV